MTISKDSVVSIEYSLTDDTNEILDSSEGMGPLEYLHGHSNIIPGLERELEGKKAGDSFKVSVKPEDAYGAYDENLVVKVGREQFPDDVEIEEGMQFEAAGPNGSHIVKVTAVEGDKVTIDANHDLAGETLHFDVKVISVRESTEEERAQGGLHSGCGCGCDHDDCEDEDCCGSGDCGCGCGH
jgi:FKBP-type peptidyl-prolyl cis-trans isomerase SlyD